MKQLLHGLALITILFPAIAQGHYLIGFDAEARTSIRACERVDDRCLAFCGDIDRAILDREEVKYLVLDQETEEKLYLLVFPYGENAETVGRYGRVLEYYDNCFLFQTVEARIPDLNRLRIEISRVPTTPVQTLPQSNPPQTGALLVDTLIQKMVNAVSSDSILAMDLRMQRMYTRYATSDSNKLVAVPWIRNKFTAYGCDTVYTQQFSNTYGHNIIGVKRGDLYPSLKRYVVICGHMDDVPSSGYAPGADDNASGTVAAIEACRVLRNYSFENTIVYAGWNAEEQGLIGSDSFAHRAQRQNDTILGVINFDMIGYVASAGRDTMNAHYTTAVPGCSLFVCRWFQAVADTYTQLKIRRVRNTGTSGSSDHASFWHSGYLALLGIERVLCPGYHTTGDTIGPSGFNNLAFATKVIQTGVAAVAKLAVPIHSGQIVEENDRIMEPALLSVRSNPARAFQIAFAVENPAEPVRLTVFDAAGRAVRRLVETPCDKGLHAVAWNGRDDRGRDLPGGVYFLDLEAGGRREIHKLVRIR
jgi:hypothetical protein